MTTRIHFLTRPGHRITLAASVLLFLAHCQILAAGSVHSHQQQQQQEPDPELIARVSGLLDSASGPDRAWGAYLAQKNGLRQLTPNLINALLTVSRDEDESEDAFLLTLSIIDS